MASLLVEDNSLPDFTESRLDSASWLISSDRSTDMELLRTSSVSERLWWRVWLDSDLDALPMLDLCSYQRKAGKLQKIRRQIKIHIWFPVNCVELITSSNFEQAPFTDFHILLLFLLTVLNYLYGIYMFNEIWTSMIFLFSILGTKWWNPGIKYPQKYNLFSIPVLQLPSCFVIKFWEERRDQVVSCKKRKIIYPHLNTKLILHNGTLYHN